MTKAVIPGLWESHTHEWMSGKPYGDRLGRLWLAYGVTTLWGVFAPGQDAPSFEGRFAIIHSPQTPKEGGAGSYTTRAALARPTWCIDLLEITRFSPCRRTPLRSHAAPQGGDRTAQQWERGVRIVIGARLRHGGEPSDVILTPL